MSKYLVIIPALIFIVTNGFAQKDLVAANKMYARLAYADAIPKYQKAVATDPSSVEAKLKLADCYRLIGNYQEAEKWYAEVVTGDSGSDVDRFHYGQMLMNNGKYTEAKKWLSVAKNERPDDQRAENLLSAIDKLEQMFADSVNYKVEGLDVNGAGNDFSAIFFKDGIVFTSSKTDIPQQKTHAWTGQSFTRLYFSNHAGTIPFAQEIQTKLNNGPATFSGKEMYTTINVSKVENAKKDIYKLNIISSKFDGKTWSKPVNFKYNNPNYNVAHPSLSADGQRLYFSSDIPGGEGGMDIYYCERKEGGWEDAVNLGKEVNTPGNEIFPAIHSDGTLYFASNGHEGIGGLDVFATSFTSSWQKPIALPFPINTRFDDFGFVIDPAKTEGYFSSNRPGGKGGDDIFHFTFSPSMLKGIVLNDDTKQAIANSTITLVDRLSGNITTTTADADGHFEVIVSSCRSYDITASHDDYAERKSLEIQTSCASTNAGDLIITFFNPKLKFEVTDRYSKAVLDNISLELFDGETKKLLASGIASRLNPSIEPCREYYIITKGDNLPEVKTWYKAPCVSKDESINIERGKPPVDPWFVGGVVYDQESQKPLDSAAVIVYGSNNTALATITTASDGSFGITGFKNVERLVFFRSGYFSVTRMLASASSRSAVVAEMPKLKLDGIIQLEGIFYDVGKFNIRPDAARVLDNVVKVMQENPTLSIELGAHTDARGNDDTNLALSDKRAKAAAQYIAEHGIDPARVQGKGYGESVLKNKCTNGTKCTEKEHQQNRRTEVKVTSY